MIDSNHHSNAHMLHDSSNWEPFKWGGDLNELLGRELERRRGQTYIYHIHQSTITLKPLIGEVNKIERLVTLAPAKGSDTLYKTASEQSIFWNQKK